jgi:(2Fe-2S) ferredoxin/sirohydrochlorin ferrochelatase
VRAVPAAILLARGIFSDQQSDELERAASVVRAAGTYAPVVGAYVDHGTPTLPDALDECAGAGATRIVVAPVYAPMDRFLNTWLPQILRRWLRRRPQFRQVEVVLADQLGRTDALGHAALETLGAAERDGGSDEIAADIGEDYANPGFWAIPAYRYQALVCTGPRCATRGSAEIYERVRERLAHLARTGRAGDVDGGGPSKTATNRVSVIRTGCLFPCNLGPIMVVHPGDTWYCSLTPPMVDEIVEQHFAGGQVVAHFTRQPGPERHTRPAPAEDTDIVEDPPGTRHLPTRRPLAASE